MPRKEDFLASGPEPEPNYRTGGLRRDALYGLGTVRGVGPVEQLSHRQPAIIPANGPTGKDRASNETY